MYKKIVLETVHYIKFCFKIYLQSYLSMHRFYNLFGIICKSIFYNLNITWNYWFISKTITIKDNVIWKCPWGPGVPSSMIWLLFIFLSNRSIWSHFFFCTQMFKLIYPLIFCVTSLYWVISLYEN